MKAKKDKIEYQAIPELGGGKICLSIFLPGSFFGGKGYSVFVGGCGNGQASTLKEAEALLLQRARANLMRTIEHAEKQADYYRKQLAALTELKRQHPKPKANAGEKETR